MKKLVFLFAVALFLSALSNQVFGQQPVSIDYRWPDSLKGQQDNVKCFLVKDNQIFAGTDSKYLWVSADTGKTWTQRGRESGLKIPFGTVWSLAKTKTGKILLGSWSGIYRSLDNGITWQKIPSFGNNMAASIFVAQSGEIFAGDEGIWKSIDDGENWSQVVDTSAAPKIASFTQTPSGAIVGGNLNPFERDAKGVTLSTNGGATWRLSSAGLSGWGKSVVEVAAYPAGSSEDVYMVSYLAGAFRSRDAGVSWEHIDAVPELKGGAVGVFPSLGVFLGFSIFQREPLYYSQGSNWQVITGFTGYAVLSFAQFDSKRLLVGTHDGMFLVTFDRLTPVEYEPQIPKGFELRQNYPNPFNPRTTIEFSLPKRSFVKLTILNLLGEKIENLVSEEREAGTYRVQWLSGGLPSGVYFYRLETDKFVSSRKMLLVK